MTTQLSTLRRRLWRRTHLAVRDLVGPPAAALRHYERRHRRGFACEPSPLTRARVLARAARADIILTGDYHSYEPTQATCLGLLELLASSGARTALCLELGLSRHQHHLDAYLEGRIDEVTFLRRIDYEHTWGFPWSSYRALLDYARRNGIPVRGINGPGMATATSLARRDRWAAGIIARTCQELPHHRLVVLVGELHLAPAHLPGALVRELRRRGTPRRIARIHQDPDALYWWLAARGREAQAVELAPDVYCLFNGTPWARLESYRAWLEAREDADGVAPSPLQSLETEAGERIRDLFHLLTRFLGLATRGCPDVTLCTPEELAWGGAGGLPPLPAPVGESLLVLGAGADLMVVSRFGPGWVAEAAAQILLEKVAPAPDPPAAEGQEAFFRRAHRVALGALGAQVLSPWPAAASFLGSCGSARDLVATYLRLLVRSLRRGSSASVPACLWEDDLRLGLAVSRALGLQAGERLYHRLQRGELAPEAIRGLYREAGDLRVPGFSRLAAMLAHR